MLRTSRETYSLRPIDIQINTNPFADGDCIISFGLTKVICTATIENRVPMFLKGKGSGWVTAEYSMLPRATLVRTDREGAKGKQSGRTMEIQRLISRSLRSVVSLDLLGENSIKIDCDVIIADGGTRTASITGGFIALYLCIYKMLNLRTISKNPIKEFLAAISCGITDNNVLLDLDFNEDSNADIDANFVITESHNLVEIQATSEKKLFTPAQLNDMLEVATNGVTQLIEKQKEALSKYII